MNHISRTATALVAAAALAVPVGLLTSAEAAKPRPDKPAKTVHGQTKQLLKDIAGKDKRLARLTTTTAVASLDDDTELSLVANIEAARAELADLTTATEAADSTVDTRAARKELRSFRIENFRIVVNVLRHAEGLAEAASSDPEATAHLAEAEAAALEIDAHSSKADIRAARAHVQAAHAELETETEVEATA